MSQDGAASDPTMLLSAVDLSDQDLKACCASAYAHPAVRWLLGGELHPGGVALTRRTLDLAELRAGELMLDVACGSGTSALLAASEFDAEVTGIEYGHHAVCTATEAASAAGVADHVRFLQGDAETLAVEDNRFDVVLCECALCTFPNQRRAVAEIHRVLRPGGRLALSDVVVESRPLPGALTEAIASIACIGGALSSTGYRQLLDEGGFTVQRTESRPNDADVFARRIEDRLRGARLLGVAPPPGSPLAIKEAIEAVGQVRIQIDSGLLGYTIFIAECSR